MDEHFFHLMIERLEFQKTYRASSMFVPEKIIEHGQK